MKGLPPSHALDVRRRNYQLWRARRRSLETMTRIRSWRRRDETGFTLIELMVVVLIIAILIAIAIPTFLGARQRAGDRAVESNVRNALTAEKTFYTDTQYFNTNSAGLLASIEPSI